MWCYRCKRLLIPYSEGALDERTREKMERHLAKCKRCASDLDAIRCVSGALLASECPDVEPAPDLWSSVNARIADQTPPRARRVWLRSPQAVSAAAAAVLIGAIGLTMVRLDIGARRHVPKPAHQATSAGEIRPPGVAADAPVEKLEEGGTVALLPQVPPEEPTAAEGTIIAAVPRDDYARKPDGVAVGLPRKEAIDEVMVAEAAPAPMPSERLRTAGRSPRPTMSAAEGLDRDREEADSDYRRVAAAGMMADRSIVGSPLRGDDAPASPASAAPVEGAAAELCYYRHADLAAQPGTESVVDALNESEGVRIVALFTYP